MEKTTELKEKKEVVTFSYLQDRKVKLIPNKRPNSWSKKFKIEKDGTEINDSAYVFGDAKQYFTVPLDRRTGLLISVLDNTTKNKTVEFPSTELTEQEFFEKSLGLSPGDLDSNKKLRLPDGTTISDSYFKKNAVCLKNESLELDLSKADDMLKYKILATHFNRLIAPSAKEASKKSTYKFVIMDLNDILREETGKLKIEMEAQDEFNLIKKDIQKMLEVIWMKDGKISNSTNIEYVTTECFKIAKNNPSEFLAIIKSPFREMRIILLRAVKAGVISRGKDQTYSLRDGFNIGTLESALKWLKEPENFDRLELIKEQIRMAS